MFNTFWLIDTVTVGTRENIGHVELFRVLQSVLRIGMRNVTDSTDRRLGMAVFANRSATEVFIIETAKRY